MGGEVSSVARSETIREAVLESSRWRRVLAAPATWPVVLAGFATLVAAWGLTSSSITVVETATLTAANRPLSDFPALLGNTDAVLAPYYLFMHGWLAFGDSLAWLRLPGVLACAGTAALLVVVGRRWSTSLGVTAGLLFAVGADVSRYAEDARPYSFAMLAATFATWRLLVAVDQAAGERRRSWAWYGVAVALLGLTHLFGLLLLPAHAWYARRRMRPWLAASAAALVVLSPLLVFGATQVGAELSWAQRPGLHALRALVGELAGSAALTVVLGVAVLGGLLRMWRGAVADRDVAVLFVGWLLLPAALLFIVSVVHAVFASRYLAFTVPALCLLAATGITALRRPLAVGVVALVVVLVMPVQLALRRSVGHDGNNLAFMARELATVARPGDGIVYEPSLARRVFADFDRPPPGRDVLLRAAPDASSTLSGSNVTPAVLAHRLHALRRVWVVRVTNSQIDASPLYRDVNRDLAGWRRAERISVTGGSIALYVAPGTVSAGG